MRTEARATFSWGLVGLRFISRNKVKGIKAGFCRVKDISGHSHPPSLLFRDVCQRRCGNPSACWAGGWLVAGGEERCPRAPRTPRCLWQPSCQHCRLPPGWARPRGQRGEQREPTPTPRKARESSGRRNCRSGACVGFEWLMRWRSWRKLFVASSLFSFQASCICPSER